MSAASILSGIRKQTHQIIRGLLTMRVTLYHEREEQLSKIASLDNYISAIDRAIRLLGYDGNLNALIPKNAGDRRYSKAK